MAHTTQIPAAIWQRIGQFLREGKTGQITIDVHLGRVRDAEFRERVKAESTDQGARTKAVVDSA